MVLRNGLTWTTKSSDGNCWRTSAFSDMYSNRVLNFLRPCIVLFVRKRHKGLQFVPAQICYFDRELELKLDWSRMTIIERAVDLQRIPENDTAAVLTGQPCGHFAELFAVEPNLGQRRLV